MKIRPIFKTIDIFSFIQFLSRQTNYIIKFFLLKVLYLVWKAVSNALKGRLFPDDDQYTLALSLLSTRSTENVCHITLLDLADAADFFAVHSGDYRDGDFYSGRWTT